MPKRRVSPASRSNVSSQDGGDGGLSLRSGQRILGHFVGSPDWSGRAFPYPQMLQRVSENLLEDVEKRRVGTAPGFAV
jgi:hypothetical protein